MRLRSELVLVCGGASFLSASARQVVEQMLNKRDGP